MKVKTSELIDAALDWAVAKCEGTLKHYVQPNEKRGTTVWEVIPQTRRYSSIWVQGGPIIEAEMMEHGMGLSSIDHERGKFAAYYWSDDFDELEGIGPTPLIAAMRALVHRKLGDEVDVPEELT